MMKNVSIVPKIDKRSDAEVERSAGHLRILMASPGGGKLNHFSELHFALNVALKSLTSHFRASLRTLDFFAHFNSLTN